MLLWQKRINQCINKGTKKYLFYFSCLTSIISSQGSAYSAGFQILRSTLENKREQKNEAKGSGGWRKCLTLRSFKSSGC